MLGSTQTLATTGNVDMVTSEPHLYNILNVQMLALPITQLINSSLLESGSHLLIVQSRRVVHRAGVNFEEGCEKAQFVRIFSTSTVHFVTVSQALTVIVTVA